MRGRHQQRSQPQNGYGKNNLFLTNQMRKDQSFDPQVQQKRKVQQLKRMSKFASDVKAYDNFMQRPLNSAEVLQLIATLPVAVLSSMSYQELVGLGLLILVSGNCAAQVRQIPQSNLATLTHQDNVLIKEKTYNEICGDVSMVTYNKPNITYGSRKGKLIPGSCLVKNNSVKKNQCTEEKRLMKEFIPHAEKLHTLRKAIHEDYMLWIKTVYNKAEAVIGNLDNDQFEIFLELYQKIENLKQIHSYALHTFNAEGGNCGEHARLSLMQLLQMKLHYGLTMKLQLVSLSSSKSTEKLIRDHGYLLLDSDINDVSIDLDQKLVKKTLDGITKGKICDRWNKGYYADFQTDDSGFYKSEAGWDSLKIQTVNLNFAHFNKLNPEAQRFICDELSQMGLDVVPRASCSIFNNGGDQAKKVKQEKKYPTQLKTSL